MVSTSASPRRRHIVETAYGLFKRDGYHATGIDRIIAEAGVAKMTMYRHFPSKDDLIVEVLNERSARFDGQIERLIARSGTASGKIAAIIGWYERWFARADFHGCAFAHALAEFGSCDHPVFRAVTAQKEGFERRLRTILEAETDETRAAQAATALVMLFEGSTLLAQMGRADEAIEGLRSSAAVMLAHAGIA